MNGFRKYLAKLLVVYVGLTNVMTPTAFAAQVYSAIPQPPVINEESAPELTQNVSPVAALPVSANRFNTYASVLGLSTNDAPIVSAHKRIGVTVEKLTKHDFQADDDIMMTLTNPDNEKYKTKIIDAAGEDAKIQVQQNVQNGVTQLQVVPTNEFKPGKYTIQVIDQDGKTTQQDFTWGVLALNPDKAIYATNETADFSMAVLDDKGAMVCDAPVNLTITNEATGTSEILSTENKKITVNPECTSHAFTIKPDYEAHYQLATVGSYSLQLTAQTANGNRTITDEIRVQDSTPFDIQRTSATRIYPPNTYPMQINVTANQDFKGVITETVPDSFAITPAEGNKSYDAMKTVYLNDNDPNANISKQVLGASTGGLVMPFDGNYPITQGFGSQLTDPTLQAFYSHYGLGGHDGIDFGLPIGTPLYAVDDGKVVWSGPGDYGTQIIIQHSWGKTYYGHMSKTSVEKDVDVKKGSLIGYSGMSGEATGPHLHFGMKPDNPDMSNGYAGKVDPMPYLAIANKEGLATRNLGVGLPGVLGASTSAAASASAADLTPTATPTPLPNLSPTQAASSSAVPGSLVPIPDTTSFTVTDAVSQQSAENQPQLLEKVKVIKWQVNLKKGDKMTLTYNFKTPQVSPQFYLLGSLKFYKNGNASQLAFDEGRQWQIAADDIGTGWYHPAVNPNSGYEWQYRKKLTIDHTKVSLMTPPTYDHSSRSNSTTSGSGASSISWTNQTVTTGQNNYLLAVWVSASNGTRNVANVSYNFTGNTTKQQLTRLTGQAYGGTGDFELWYATFASAGASSMNITANLSGSAIFGTGATLLYDVNQTTPFGTSNTSTSANKSINTTVTSNTSQLIIDGVSNQNGATGNNWNTTTQNVTFNNTSYVGLQGSYRSGSSPTTTMTWNDTTNDNNIIIAVPVNGYTQDESNFPVLVNITDSNLQSHIGQSNGNDIVFTDSGGEDKLSHEIETYNSSTGNLIAWVKVPNLSASTDTDIYLYYGNPSVGSQQDPTGVWDTNYKGIWHLPNGSSLSVNDSTSLGNNGTNNGVSATTGQIDGGGLFVNSSSDYINVSALANDVTGNGSMSVSLWFKPTSTFNSANGNDQYLFDLGNSTSNNDFSIRLDAAAGSMYFAVQNGANVNNEINTPSNTTWSSGTWYYVTATYNSSSGMSLYVNGNLLNSNSFTSRGTTSATAAAIGQSFEIASKFFDGTIDEVQVSNTTRSADWVSTEYNNQNSPGTFLTVGATEETKVYAASNDMLMRHGKFWDNDATNHYGEQPFLF